MPHSDTVRRWPLLLVLLLTFAAAFQTDPTFASVAPSPKLDERTTFPPRLLFRFSQTEDAQQAIPCHFPDVFWFDAKRLDRIRRIA